MTLPATTIEAEPLARARVLAREFRDGITQEAGYTFAVVMMKQYALFHVNNMLQVIAWARTGAADCEAAVLELANEFLNRGELDDHRALAVYVMEHNAGLHRRSGRSRVNHVMRNICLVGMVADLVERFGLKPTRSRHSRSSERPTACKIVAQALKEEFSDPQFKLSERAIEGVWERFSPTFFRWSALTFGRLVVP